MQTILCRRRLGEARPENLPHLRFRCPAKVEHPRGGREVAHGFQVLYDDCLLWHWIKLAYSGVCDSALTGCRWGPSEV
jgi:hypothetical protein